MQMVVGGAGMNRIKAGDLVTRPSYNDDILFMVVKIDDQTNSAILRGYFVRLLADAPLDDLTIWQNDKEQSISATKKNSQQAKNNYLQHSKIMQKQKVNLQKRENGYGHIYGSVLHLDGDKKYLEMCLLKYDELKISVNGYYIDEEEQPNKIQKLLRRHRPDILVITGHDGMRRRDDNDLNSYHNSRYFVESVIKARELVPAKDSLTIFAGACQSNYEILITAGANYASSPKRINIHTFDPVKVVELIALTSIREMVSIKDVIANSLTGDGGIGGIESRGKMRLVLPNI